MIDELSYCVLNITQSPGCLDRCIRSIHAQSVGSYEILMGGHAANAETVTYVGDPQWLEAGKINKLKNELCQAAGKQYVVLIDSAVELAPDWYANIRDVEYYDVFGSAVTVRSGERAIDWAYLEQIAGRAFPQAAAYDEWSPRIFPGPWLIVLRRKVWDRVRFDESLLCSGTPGNEDADFCRQLVETGYRHGVVPQSRATLHRQAGRKHPKPLATFTDVNNYLAPYKRARDHAHEAIDSRRYVRAARWLADAVRIMPGDAMMHIDLAIVYRITGRCAEAVMVLNDAMQANPDSPALLCARGMAHLQMADAPSAQSDFDRALAGADDQAVALRIEALQGLAWARLLEGPPQEAAECFKSLIEQAGLIDRALVLNAYHGLTWCYCAMGQFEQARRCFIKAAECWDVNDILQKRSLRRARRLADEGKSDIAESLSLVLAPDLYVCRRGASYMRKLAGKVKGRLVRMLRGIG